MKRPLTIFCIGVMLICVMYYYICHKQSPPPELPAEAVTLQGRVTSWENRYEGNILYLTDIYFYGSSANEIATDNSIGLRCYVESMQEVKLGQTVAVQGFLALPGEALNEGGFDAAEYYAGKGYEYVLYEADILEYGQKYDWLLQLLYELKTYAVKQLYTYLSPEDAGILSAMLTGDKSNVDTETKELYKTVGIYHILAISGLHIAMIGGIVFKTLKLLRIKPFWAAAVSMVVLVLYGILIGMPPSAFRAVVMFCFGLVSALVHRSHDKITSLAVAGVCLIWGEPLLFFDAGVQLSFLAVLGIVTLYPTFLGLHQHHMRIGDGIFVSLAVAYITLPVIMNAYYEVPLYSLLANACILPFVAVLLGAGFVIVMCGAFLGMVAKAAALLVHCILFFYEKVLVFLSGLPGNSYVTGAPEKYKIIAFYIILGGLIYVISRKKRLLLIRSLKSENAYMEGFQKQYAGEQEIIRKSVFRMRVVQITVMVLLVVFLVIPEKFDCRITFLNVGQGDGICVETGSEVYLIDCGSTSEENIGEYALVPFLKHHGITQVDGWFLTHPDADHTDAFTELCREKDMGGVNVETLYLPLVLKDEFEEIILQAKEHNINVVMLQAGDILSENGLVWKVLSPSEQLFYGDENDASLVLYLELAEFRGLFMGDAGTMAEEELMKLGIHEVTLLKVAHHGSGIGTNSEDFLEEMSPDIAVISCGRYNSYGHPHEEVLERLMHVGSDIYRTDTEGQVSVTIRGEYLIVNDG